jgi:nicotinate-nucleotide--dimethylbenzimidazole phosphoribosyltransferase
MPRSPFDDIRSLLDRLPPPDDAATAAVETRNATLLKPRGALGRLEDLALWLAGWQGRSPPRIDRPLVAIFAATHGVTDQGVSAYPSAVTRAIVDAIAAGGAGVNQLALGAGAGLKVFDLALDHPTGDFTQGPALSARDCVATMAFGMECLAEGTDCLALGEVGIGNTTAAAAICAALYGGGGAAWVGPGAGLTEGQLARKIAAVDAGLARHAGALDDPLEVLARLGGREIAAMAGAILAARLQQTPMVLDGYVVGAAAAVLHAINPAALDHCVAGHVSGEPAHRSLLARLGKAPLLDLGMRLGEGSGAALALQVLKAACATHAGMATFADIGLDMTPP